MPTVEVKIIVKTEYVYPLEVSEEQQEAMSDGDMSEGEFIGLMEAHHANRYWFDDEPDYTTAQIVSEKS